MKEENSDSRESNRKEKDVLQNYLDAAEVLMVALDPAGKVSLINKMGCVLLGYRKEEIIDKNWFDNFLPEKDRSEAKADFRRMLAEEVKKPRHYESSVLIKSGEEKIVEWNTAFLRDDSGDVTGLLSSGNDITGRKRVEKERGERTREATERIKELNCLYAISDLVEKPGISLEEILQGTVDLIPPALQYPEITCARIILKGQEFKTKNFRETPWKQTSEMIVHGDRIGALEACYLGEKPPGDEVPFLKEERRLINAIAERLGKITERKLAEEKLRESESHFQRLFDLMVDPVVIVDARGKFLLISDGLEKLTGLKKEELLGKNFLLTPVTTAKSKAILIKNLAKRMMGMKIAPYEIEATHQDGRRTPVEVNASKIEYLGKPADLVIFRDVSARKAVEERLRESETHFLRLFNLMVDPTVIVNGKGVLVEINDSVERISGYKREELVGRNFLKTPIVTAKSKAILMKSLAKRMMGMKVAPYEIEVKTKDGKRLGFEVNAAKIEYMGKPADMGIFRDVTTRKQAEENLKEALVELERSNRELEQFVYVASHDLQEPLRMVASFTGLLAKRYQGKLDKDADEFISYAVDGAKRMQYLINDLLAYSRVGTRGKPFKPTDCEEVFKQSVANLQTAIEETGAVVTHEQLPPVMADETQLLQLFQNLIGNAIKFHGEEPPRVHISAKQQEDAWMFSVRDNGIGIAPEYFERIFQVFHRLHGRDRYSGTGMGLAICKKIVERHEGKIWPDSKTGKGSTFYFTMPTKGGKAS
ncbi:MAG: PAS domain S-box protein [PVC group bacterium]